MAQDFIGLVISKLKDPVTKVSMSNGSLVFNNGTHEVTCHSDRIYIWNTNKKYNSTTHYIVKGFIDKWRYYRAWRKRLEKECAKCL